MLISTKGRYALRVMLELAQGEPGECMPLPVIAQRQGISEKYLESILAVLSKAGLLDAVRGIETGTEQQVTLSIAVGVENRIAQAEEQGVPICNYGIVLAAMTGILDKVVYPN